MITLQSETGSDGHSHEILNALPIPVYATNTNGELTFFNTAAARRWERQPRLGDPPPTECSDVGQVPCVARTTPLRGSGGTVIGAVTMLMDPPTDPGPARPPDEAAQHLAAIVSSSDDAILSKDLNGVITSWNRGAERLFGYTAAEAVGQSVTMLIPPDRQDEEPVILGRIRSGERIDHYETVRRRKDGSLIEISLTVSPVKSAAGVIIGASKIARDITERRRAQERQTLLLREMNHRVKNVFALSSSVVSLSARTASTPADLASALRGRLAALARAHALTLSGGSDSPEGEHPATLHALVEAIALPYENGPGGDGRRVVVTGPDIQISGDAVTSFALLLHEFATNAAKHGALSVPAGHIEIASEEIGDDVVLTWRERNGPPVDNPEVAEGFGSLLARLTVTNQFGGKLARDWQREGLTIRLSIPSLRLRLRPKPAASQPGTKSL
jgi:PAS domain S-box-containing protein